MGQTNISIRIDEEIKRDAETLFAKLGLTLSSATNVFFRQAVRKQSMPFKLKAENHEVKARKAFGKLFAKTQKQSVINGTDKMTLEEINEIITECRHETDTKL